MIISSEVQTVNASDQDVFTFLTNFNKFQDLMPEQIINWQSEEESCSFTIKGLSDIKMKIKEKTAPERIVIESEANMPVAFDLIWQISPKADNSSDVQLVFEGSISPMISMMVKSPLQNFVNVLVSKLKEYYE